VFLLLAAGPRRNVAPNRASRYDRVVTAPRAVVVTSWNHLLDELYAEAWREQLRRFRSSYAYRGQGRQTDELRTSLSRLGEASRELEGHMLRNFRKYAQREAVPYDSIWNWLAVAQHHGLPTRLLDWTYSPFVALHFVTDRIDHFDQDGMIWCVDFVKTNRLLPDSLRQVLKEEGADAFTAESLTRVARTLHEFDAQSNEDFLAFFEPPSLDERIINQFALFSLTSSPHVRLDQWLAARPDVYKTITVPASLKWEVRDKLDQANITERVLYPGLDGLSLWLKRYYTPTRG
jgi:hypothetical protein